MNPGEQDFFYNIGGSAPNFPNQNFGMNPNTGMLPNIPNVNNNSFFTINNKLNKLEQQLKRLEARISRLENPYGKESSYNNIPDNNMYMM